MNINTNSKGLLYPNPCPHCGKANSKKGCYEFFGEQNGRKYGVCVKGAKPGNGWEQALTRDKQLRRDKAGNLVYQEIVAFIPKKPDGVWVYQDKEGNPLVKIAKHKRADGGKDYFQYHWNEQGWQPGVKNYIKREDIPIYRYQEVREAIAEGKTIWIVEGEKCADKLFTLGVIATCNIGGSGKWRPSDTKCLARAKEIILCPDCDRPGVKHMDMIYSALIGKDNQLKVSQSSTDQKDKPAIKWLYVFPDYPQWLSLPEKGGLDISDWLESQKSIEDIYNSVEEAKRDFSDSNQSYNGFYRAESSSQTDSNNFSENVQDKLNFLLYDEEGKKRKIKNSLLIDVIKAIYGDKLRFNLQTFEPWLEDKPFKEVEGDLELLYLRLAHLYGLELPKEKTIDALLTVAKQKSFSPVENYLKYVAKNVAPANIDNLAAKYLGVDDELANTYLKLWLLAAAARALYPGCYIRNVLILQGKQDKGKTTFFKILGKEHFSESLGDSRDKDQLLVAHAKWILEWGEFETVWGRKLRGEVKRFISATEDTFRVPYGRGIDTYPRKFILCGTTNEKKFLCDPTGNTRFWVIQIAKEVPLKELKKERNAIWSAATNIVLKADPETIMSGELFSLQKHLLGANEENTTRYVETHPWEDLLQELIEGEGDCGILLSSKIWEKLEIETKEQPRHATKISNLMTKLGWQRSEKRRRGTKGQHRVWKHDDLTEEDVDVIWNNSFRSSV